jgi:predicted nucleic acid-binding protein
MSASETDLRVFVDTSAFYAAVDRRDASHGIAPATMRDLSTGRRRLITTNAVLFELHGLLLNRLGRRVAAMISIIWIIIISILFLWRPDNEYALRGALGFVI